MNFNFDRLRHAQRQGGVCFCVACLYLNERNATFVKDTWKTWHPLSKGMLCTSQGYVSKSWKTFSEECGPFCRKILHAGMPQLSQRMPQGTLPLKGFIFSISIALLAMEGCFMLKGTFHNIYHTLIKGHYTLSKEYCIHSKALFWIKLSDCNMQLQTNWFDILCMYPEHF